MGALPFASLRLADMGADVVRIERLSEVPEDKTPRPHNYWDRGRRSIAVDLKNRNGVETVLRLAEKADAFLESFRPGVVERLGVGPQIVMRRNPRIVYGRLTGWGQDGPLANAAGHSLNYEAITGLTHAIGARDGAPVPLLQIIGDFAGGGAHLAYGVVCALFSARRTGKGQIVDAAMVDGVISTIAPFYSMHALGMHTDDRGTNLFDGGAPYYNIYETKDGKFVTVAPIEPHFYALLLERLGLDSDQLPDQNDQSQWELLRDTIGAAFRTKTRDEWTEILAGTDACFAPVLNFSEARHYEHNVERRCFLSGGDVPELLPTPRLSETPGKPGRSPLYPGADTDSVLSECGFSESEVAELRATGAIA
jgi:alpha-methylacyl-CoA racemase